MAVRIGVIGAGTVSKHHMEAYAKLKDVKVEVVCDLNEERARKAASTYSISRAVTDHRQLLNEKLDAVSICTWNNTHASLTIDCLRAGVNVICEKPPAMNTSQAVDMLNESKKSKKLLMIGFTKRFTSKLIAVKKLVDDGVLGNIYSARAAFLRRAGNPGGWFADIKRSGGGPLIDLGVHNIDQARFLMGKPKVKTVSAVTYSKLGLRGNITEPARWLSADFNPKTPSTVEDQTTAFIRFDNGASLAVDVSYSQHRDTDEQVYLDLYGDKAGVSLEPKLVISSESNDCLTDTFPWVAEDVYQKPFDRELSHFIDCVRDGATCLNPPEDGVEIMRILDGIYESARLNREVQIS
jgi:predicted dehydrogenase